MKILHLPTRVGGNSWGLSQGERRIGLDSSVLIYDSKSLHIKYKADIIVPLPEETESFQRPKLLARLLRTFFRIRNRYDVFHFNFGSSLLNIPRYGMYSMDLPFYPSKARLFVTYNGCDARQKYPTMARAPIASCHNPLCYGGMCNSGEQDSIRRKNIAKFARHVDYMFALNPDLLWFLPEGKASFLPYTVANWYDEMEKPPLFARKKLRIVHSTTDRECKGTDLILRSLRKVEGMFPGEVEVVLVEGMSYQEALANYREADLVVDEIFGGWYSGVAVEVMRMGKPVAVYIREEDLHFIPSAMRKEIDDAFIRISPDSMDDVLGRFVSDRNALREKGENGYQFVNKWHDPERIALQVKERYEMIR